MNLVLYRGCRVDCFNDGKQKFHIQDSPFKYSQFWEKVQSQHQSTTDMNPDKAYFICDYGIICSIEQSL